LRSHGEATAPTRKVSHFDDRKIRNTPKDGIRPWKMRTVSGLRGRVIERSEKKTVVSEYYIRSLKVKKGQLIRREDANPKRRGPFWEGGFNLVVLGAFLFRLPG